MTATEAEPRPIAIHPSQKPWANNANRDALVRAFSFQSDRVDYLLNISTFFRCVYFETPKVACSTIKRALQEAEIDRTGGALPDDVHDKTVSPLRSPSDITVPLPTLFSGDTYFRFTFVRNPYTRILSAYLDKIVKNDWERRRHYPALGFRLEDRPTFLDFLTKVEMQTNLERDIHWLPQSELLAWDRIQMHFIGRFEAFGPYFTLLGRKLYGSSSEKYCAARIDNHQTNAAELVKQHVGPKERDIIERIYNRDFDLYCYNRDPHFASLG